MADSVWFVLAIIVVALVFDFTNGWHDAANSIATVVSTRVLTPTAAIVWAACFNFLAAFVFTTAVASTIGKGVIHPAVVDATVILSALIGAIAWNLITWYAGIPSSSSHALMGGLAGAAISKAGFAALVWPGKWVATLVFIILAPTIGLLIALALTVALSWALRRAMPRRVDRAFRVLQLGSAAAYSQGHGGNDAQKTMGVIVGLLLWVILVAHAAIAAGTVAGGWRIVRTMGQRLTKLRPFGGFCAETSGAIVLFGLTFNGIPASTTHTITGAITGVGVAQRVSAVRWGLAGRIVWAWILTIPASAGIALLSYLLLRTVVR